VGFSSFDIAVPDFSVGALLMMAFGFERLLGRQASSRVCSIALAFFRLA